jgi:hypothetical protein
MNFANIAQKHKKLVKKPKIGHNPKIARKRKKSAKKPKIGQKP